jgi:hypothetical protein
MLTIGKTTEESQIYFNILQICVKIGKLRVLFNSTQKVAPLTTSALTLMVGRSRSFILIFSNQDPASMDNLVKSPIVHILILTLIERYKQINGLRCFLNHELLISRQITISISCKMWGLLINKPLFQKCQLNSNAINNWLFNLIYISKYIKIKWTSIHKYTKMIIKILTIISFFSNN